MLSAVLSALKRKFKKPVPVRQSWVDQPTRYNDIVEFLNWFNTTSSIQETLNRATLDWKIRFKDFPQFAKIQKRKSLEVGFGGGRLILNAAKDFEHAYGVDIHKAFDMTRKFLATQSCKNFTLLQRDELSKIEDGSIDFVYSFIVFQHFDTIEEVRFYISEIKRVLNKNGYAHIYFGVNHDKGVKVVSDAEFKLRECSLFIEPELMKRELENDFEILDVKERLPKNPVTGEGVSDQASIAFKLK